MTPTEDAEQLIEHALALNATEGICERRVQDLVERASEEEAALPLAAGSASLRGHEDLHGDPAVELAAQRSNGAELLISIDSTAQVTCMIRPGGYAHEVYSQRAPRARPSRASESGRRSSGCRRCARRGRVGAGSRAGA